MLLGPRHHDSFYSALRAVGPRRARLDNGFKVHRIEMPPLPLCGVVLDLAGLLAIGTATTSAVIFDLNDDFEVFHLKIDAGHDPGLIQTEKQTIVAVKLIWHTPIIAPASTLLSLKIAH